MGSFPDTQDGKTSAITFDLTSTTTLTLDFSQFNATGAFVVQGTTGCTGVQFNGICKVTVDFAPTATGLATGNLNFAYMAGTDQGTDSIPLSGTGTASSTPCRCANLTIALRDFRREHNDHTLIFSLHWKLECSPGSIAKCFGQIRFSAARLRDQFARHDQRLGFPKTSKTFTNEAGLFEVHCGGVDLGCPRSTSGVIAGFEVTGLPLLREDLTVTWRLRIYCDTGLSFVPNEREETLKLHFDHHGNLDLAESDLSG